LSGTNGKKKPTITFKMECDDWGSNKNDDFSGDFTIKEVSFVGGINNNMLNVELKKLKQFIM
jgi:hypothetical protein